jgi:hypothetical protein
MCSHLVYSIETYDFEYDDQLLEGVFTPEPVYQEALTRAIAYNTKNYDGENAEEYEFSAGESDEGHDISPDMYN